MSIAGLTDRYYNNSFGRIEITAFKGTRKIPGITADGKKYDGYGKDLGNLIRLTTDNAIAKNILKKSYGSPDVNGDFFTEVLRVYLPHDEIDRTFATNMSAYKDSGLEVVCDRVNILKKCVMLSDKKGQYRSLTDCEDTPCPMVGKSLSMSCEYGCTPQGQLLFYVKELLDNDMMVAGRMTVHSLEDISHIDLMLRQYQEILGMITNSSFPCSQYRHKIPFLLTRSQVNIKTPMIEKKLRTGKKTDKVIWAISIQVDPEYMALRRAWMDFQERVSRSLPVPKSVVEGLLRGDPSVMNVIDVEVVETPLLPPAPIWKSWTKPEDAIAWAMTKVPSLSEDELWVKFNDLQPSNGKKAPTWFSVIQTIATSQLPHPRGDGACN